MENQLVRRFQVKEVDDAARTFSGLAATWDLDLGGDIIEEGAFKRTLNSWRKSKRVLPLLDSHNGQSVRSVVGKMLDAEETSEGLEASFEMIDGPDGEEVYRRVKGGYVDGLSIGYSAIRQRFPESEEERAKGVYRYLQEVKLHEVSVVLWPMNTSARINTATAKALLDAAKDRTLDDGERAALKALSIQISALLAGGDGAPEGPAPEMLANLEERIQRLHLRQLVTRIEATRHLAEKTLGG